jgi:hypothetical protein
MLVVTSCGIEGSLTGLSRFGRLYHARNECREAPQPYLPAGEVPNPSPSGRSLGGQVAVCAAGKPVR